MTHAKVEKMFDPKLTELLEQLSVSAHGNGLYLDKILAKPEDKRHIGDRCVVNAIQEIVNYIEKQRAFR